MKHVHLDQLKNTARKRKKYLFQTTSTQRDTHTLNSNVSSSRRLRPMHTDIMRMDEKKKSKRNGNERANRWKRLCTWDDRMNSNQTIGHALLAVPWPLSPFPTTSLSPRSTLSKGRNQDPRPRGSLLVSRKLWLTIAFASYPITVQNIRAHRRGSPRQCWARRPYMSQIRKQDWGLWFSSFSTLNRR